MLVLLYIYIYINSTNIPPIMIINRIYEHQNLLSLQLVSFLVRLRTYQLPCTTALAEVLSHRKHTSAREFIVCISPAIQLA